MQNTLYLQHDLYHLHRHYILFYTSSIAVDILVVTIDTTFAMLHTSSSCSCNTVLVIKFLLTVSTPNTFESTTNI